MDYLLHLDQAWLLAINQAYLPWADTFFYWVSNAYIWVPFYVLLVYLLLRRYGWRQGIGMIVALFVAAGMADYISSGIIKPLVCRFRPTHEPALEGMVHLVRGYAGGLYGFVSSHAANTMAVAALFCWLYPCRKHLQWLIMLSWVLLNCYSRMYMGVHYPGDIIGGLLVGWLVAWLVYRVLRYSLLRNNGDVDGGTQVGS